MNTIRAKRNSVGMEMLKAALGINFSKLMEKGVRKTTK